MRRNIAVPATLADLAAGQWGLITNSQARQQGMSAQTVARLAEDGVLERLRHGVYRISGAPPGAADPLRVAWLALRPALSAAQRLSLDKVEVVSHQSAAQLHQLGNADADRLEFTTPDRRQARDRDVRFHRAAVTSVAR